MRQRGRRIYKRPVPYSTGNLDRDALRCKSKNYIILADESVYIDQQPLKLQESPEVRAPAVRVCVGWHHRCMMAARGLRSPRLMPNEPILYP